MTVLLSKKAKMFAKYDEEAREIYIMRKDASKMTPGERYKVRVFLSDAQMSLEYTFSLIVANLTRYELPMLPTISEGGTGGKNEELYSSLDGPTPTIKSIDYRGNMLIVFDKEVALSDLDFINNGTVEIEGVKVPVLQVQAMPGNYSEAHYLNMTWNATAKTARTLTLEVTFAAHFNVSMSLDPDYMQVIFNDPLMCFAVGGGVIDKKKRLLTKNLPRQLPKGKEGDLFEDLITAVITATKVVIASNFLLNIFLTVALQYVLGMINTQQLIVLLPLFDIKAPANAELFFRQLMSVVAFEVYDTGDIVNATLSLEEVNPVNENYNTVGFESVYFINNMGTLFIVFMMYPVMMLLEYLLGLVASRCDIFVKVHHSFKHFVYWNYLITLVFESYLVIVICCLINFQHMSWSETGLIVQSVLTIICFAIIVVLPIYSAWVFWRNFKNLSNK